jgi:putative ABC transport system permease protein
LFYDEVIYWIRDIKKSVFYQGGITYEKTLVGLADHRCACDWNRQQDKSAYIPIVNLQIQYGLKIVDTVMVKAKSKETRQIAMDQASKYLNRKHNKEDYYRINSPESMISESNTFSKTLTTVFSSVAGISLLVGGIGVMNIMLVSATERTREIGIRKALGALRRDILLQFLIESLIVCLIGGTIGVLLGVGIAAIISLLVQLPPVVSWESIFTAFGFSCVIGIFFGIYPANKAARLNPIDALRYE